VGCFTPETEGKDHVPNLKRVASAAAAAASLALAVPAGASAATSATAAGAAATATSAPNATQVSSGCSSAASIGWLSHNRVYGGGWMTCPRPFPTVVRTVDATLYRNHLAVAYGRSDCDGLAETCSVHSPAVANPAGIQTWCSYCRASYTPIAPARGRHRYCAEAVFFFAGKDSTQTVWSCKYQG
jgi:hypothetical protein